MKQVKLLRIDQKHISMVAAVGLFLLLYSYGFISFKAFGKPQVFLNLWIDNAYLIVMATGLAFVIITGGIDLSIASVLALTTMVVARLLELGVSPIITILIAMSLGAGFGFVQGYLITSFNLHPWIVTLGGMFFARGACYLISIQSIIISDPLFQTLSKYKIRLSEHAFLSVGVVIALIVVAIGIFVSIYTPFGRTVYAIGGNEASAELMGLPVKRTKIIVYMISGFTASLSGLLFTLYMLSGYSLHALGTEMDAIAACVVGGILLTGGFGYILGPTIGVISMGTIQMLIMFQGSLSSWWTKIAIGVLLLIFIVLQRTIVLRNEKRAFSGT